MGLSAAGSAIERYIGTAVDEEGVLILAGRATIADIDDEGFVNTLEDGEWEGQWGEGAESGPVDGTFTGIRR
jgi:hypothetical protein